MKHHGVSRLIKNLENMTGQAFACRLGYRGRVFNDLKNMLDVEENSWCTCSLNVGLV